MDALQAQREAGRLHGLVDLTPGIRSLQVHFDPSQISREDLLAVIVDAEAALPPVDDMQVPSRIVHLPLSWDDPQTRLAIEKYMQSVRKDAPWCPSNIEFIRRINGLDSVDDVLHTVFEASYLVLGLGDVYLGAPVATPVDPRHRLVTTKYNPARTWTPENAVGIGGAYMCVYGMEGPGGYQFVGRTLQMWNRWQHGEGRAPFEQPWLLRFFDQVRFYPVSHEELQHIRSVFPQGGYPLRIEQSTFSLGEYRQFLAEHAADMARFKAKQQAAFHAERDRWAASQDQQDMAATEANMPPADQAAVLPEGGRMLTSHVPGNVWKVVATEGQVVQTGEVLLIIESMKMEFNVLAPCDGTIHQVLCKEGTPVAAGQDMLVLLQS
jgi:urea carboxylase